MKAPRDLLATLALCLGLFVATSASAEHVVTVTDTARQHFKAGVAYIDDPAGAKFEEAYREFKIAYAESPSYRILSNLGLCALSLERDGEAIEAYEGFLAEATPDDIPKDQREQMERDITTLKASLVKLVIRGTPATLVVTDERIPSMGGHVINRYNAKDGSLSLGLHPGHHWITVSAEGYEEQTWELEADPAGAYSREFGLIPRDVDSRDSGAISSRPLPKSAIATTPTLVDEKPPGRKLSPLFYVALASTGVFATSAIITGIVSREKRQDYDAVNRNGMQPERASELRRSTQTYALLSDISLGAALLSAGATVWAYVAQSSSKAEPPVQAARWRVFPTLSEHHAEIGLLGQF